MLRRTRRHTSIVKHEEPRPTAKSPRPARWIALGVSSLLSGSAFLVYWQLRVGPGPELIWVESDEAGARKALEESAADPAAPPALPWRYYLPEAVAAKLMPQVEHGLRQYDPWRYFAYPPLESFERPSPGERDTSVYRTNELGLRGPEVRRDGIERRVVVAGDSHLEGHRDKFPDLLEERLASHAEIGATQVFNAGHGAYSLFHYFGTLELFLAKDLRPDVFVLSLFAGNDFADSVMLWDFFAGRKLQRVDPEHSERIAAARGPLRHAFGQGLTSAEYFREDPDREGRALTCAKELVAQIRDRCAEEGVALVVVLIPAPHELPEAGDPHVVRRAMEHQGLLPADLAAVTRVRTAFGGWLREVGIRHVDLHALFQAYGGRLYDETLHVDKRGHRLAADALMPILVDLLR